MTKIRLYKPIDKKKLVSIFICLILTSDNSLNVNRYTQRKFVVTGTFFILQYRENLRPNTEKFLQYKKRVIL